METTTNRQLRIARKLKAPIKLVWEVFSKPEHIAHWWGPNGFTNTIHKMEFKVGGEWKFIMHGPDGTDYANRSIYKEIIPLKKIVFEHSNPHFIATILFEAKGNETLLDWTVLLDSAEILQAVIKAHKADEGLKQNVEKLQAYLNQKNQSKTNDGTVIVERVFKANLKLMWKALTEKEQMKQWYIDVEEFETIVGFKFDFWAGEEGGKQWKHLCEITEVIPERKLTYSWKYDGYSGMSYVTFELFEEGNGTKLKLTHTGLDTFPADVPELAIHNFERGWNQLLYDSLNDFLEQ